MRARVGLLLAFLVACADDGKDGRDGTRVEVEDLAVGSKECPSGGLLLVVGGDRRPVCNGINGLDGKPGMNADPGQGGYQPTLSVLCGAGIDLLNGAANIDTPQIIGTDGVAESYFQYSVVVYSNGDAQTTCGVTLGTLATSSGGAYYAGTAKGATNRYCQVAIDYPPAPAMGNSGGIWEFKVDQKTPLATYSDQDPGHPLHGNVMDFFADECVIRKFTNGTWVDGTFADL